MALGAGLKVIYHRRPENIHIGLVCGMGNVFFPIEERVWGGFFKFLGLERRHLVGLHSPAILMNTQHTETEALALPVREFGAVCRVAYEHLTSATNILKHY